MLMNMAFNMLTDIAILVKKQKQKERDSVIKKFKGKLNIFINITKTFRNIRITKTLLPIIHIVI